MNSTHVTNRPTLELGSPVRCLCSYRITVTLAQRQMWVKGKGMGVCDCDTRRGGATVIET